MTLSIVSPNASCSAILSSFASLLNLPVSVAEGAVPTPQLLAAVSSLSGKTDTVSIAGWSPVLSHLCSLTSTPALLPSNAAEAAAADGFVSSFSNSLSPLLPLDALPAYHASVVAELLGSLQSHLGARTYLADARGSYADVFAVLSLHQVSLKGADLAKAGENVRRFYNTVAPLLKVPVIEEKEKEEKPAKGAAKGGAPAAGGGSAAPLAEDSPLRSSNAILASLAAQKMPHSVLSHAAAFTSDELNAAAPGLSHTKNLFLKDKKHGYFMVTALHDSDTNAKIMTKAMGLTGANPRMGSEDDLLKLLGAKKGMLGPMCVSCDAESKVRFVLDSRLLDCATVYSHPSDNTLSVGMSPEHVKQFVEATGHEVAVVDFPLKGEAAAAPAKGAEKGKGGKAAKEAPKKKQTKDGETLLKLQYKKMSEFHDWYSDVITLSEMISYYDISGCYILRPWSYKIWDSIQNWFNGKLEPMGVENACVRRASEAERRSAERSGAK